MPYIQITISEGRSRAAKNKLLQDVSQAAADALDVPIKNVRAWIIDVPVSDMSIAGLPLDEIRARREAGDRSL